MQTNTYLGRQIDSRIVSIIQKHLPPAGSVLDLGSGSGIYGKILSKNHSHVIAYDYDAVLCQAAEKTQSYAQVICDNASNLSSRVKTVDAIFCSEFLEHIPAQDLRQMLDAMEAICKETIVITMPNPFSPHFKDDPTHITSYTIHSMKKILNESKLFQYSMHPTGFSQYNLKKPFFRLLDPIAKSIPICSPTILYVGKRK